MAMHDIMMILVMAVPLILFSLWPGILLGDYIYKRKYIDERMKRIVIITIMIIFALLGATYLHFGL